MQYNDENFNLTEREWSELSQAYERVQQSQSVTNIDADIITKLSNVYNMVIRYPKLKSIQPLLNCMRDLNINISSDNRSKLFIHNNINIIMKILEILKDINVVIHSQKNIDNRLLNLSNALIDICHEITYNRTRKW